MERFIINGGKRLSGKIEVSGMKNAALPIIFSTILVEDRCIIENIPEIRDVTTALEIITAMGARVRMLGRTTVEIDTTGIVCGSAPYELARSIRASYYILGAELGRFGMTTSAFPGGCNFITRPIDLHIKGFEALGATVSIDEGSIHAFAKDGLKANSIYLDIESVGATINIILAAVKAEGLTIIDNAAREPHIVDLANFLNSCGANISGAGTDVIKIRGVKSLHGVSYAIIPDMIEAGTYMIAAAATHSVLTVANIIPKHLESITAKLEEMGAEVIEVSLPHLPYSLGAYYIIMPSEVSSNLARYDGMRYGLRVMPPAGVPQTAANMMAYTREAGFGDEVKRRIILGTYALSAGYYDAWYGSAQKVRTLIIDDFKKAFEQVDVLVAPTSPSTAFKFGEKMDDPLAMYMNDIATIPANLAGVPAMSIPAGLSDDGLPVGFQFIAPQQRDEVMYKPAAALEAALEDSWNGPIWNDLKTPWLDGLGK